ncbi:ribonuclease R [Paenibacillus pini]|uniref:Ribonuclease R n=1 Tax=Paenibacillus pini JCM 16418 TaxID=1236976 RepID=W7Z498_9BACL|nr:ribonuclease R [Paenibacillus pini]GAF09179.1 3'-to-5' exoribonuclease RNase R [Paenibacillus pini JCM 16418]
MITEQTLLDWLRDPAYKPMTYQELEKHFEIRDALEFKDLIKLLNALEQDGKIIMTNGERYGVPERLDLLRGRLQAHAKGFAFLIPDDKEHPDVYINANDLKSAMNGDTVLAKVTSQSPAGGKLEGVVVSIVNRAVTQIVGVFQGHEAYGFVLPDDKRINRDIFVPKHAFGGAVDGDKVVAKIVSYPEGKSAAEGAVIEILGHKDDPGVDILSIIRKHQLPEGFPEEVLAEAEQAPDSITEEEIVSQGRRDLRGKNIVTIDGEDAKDLDDAVNVELLPNGHFRLGVHIADVGYYVRENSELDKEAYSRGCSVYLVDRVIPMIPHRLSNGICSLNPQVDRLTLSCEMEFDEQMKVVSHDVFTSVIKTKERMTYSNVRKILEEEDPELMERYSELVGDFRLMKELALKLRGRRMKRGAVDFDFVESKVILDESGKPIDIVKRERSIAEQIIEEFMLAANETVAEHFYWLKVPFLYRIHENPDPEKLQNFMAFAANFGHHVKGRGNDIHPRALQNLLEDIQGTKEQTVISTMMLRSMKQAKYAAETSGHFGLAAEYYSHFTSPIRRYPDLAIHRVIREVIENKNVLSDKRQEYLAARMPDIAQQSSERERVAVEAERDTDQLKKAEFMLDKVGEDFDGIISSVTSFGMFIELENTVEGLIRLSSLSDDYYHFDESSMSLIGERTSNVYRIGDDIKIRVARVNMDDHTIDFELPDMKPRREGNRGGGFGGRGGAGRKGGAPAREGGATRGGRGAAKGSGGERGSKAGAGKGAGAVPASRVTSAGGRKRGGKGGAVHANAERSRTVAGDNSEATRVNNVGAAESASPASSSEGRESKGGKRGIHANPKRSREGVGGKYGDPNRKGFAFGSGKGGYGAAPSSGGDTYISPNSSAGRRKKTSENGVFIGEGATRGRNAGGSGAGKPAGENSGTPGEGGRKRKKKTKGEANNSTAGFVRKNQ